MTSDAHQPVTTSPARASRTILRRRTAALAVVAVTVTLTAGWFVARIVGVGDAVAWTAVASVSLVVVVGQLLARLDDNHPPDAPTEARQPEPTLGPATHVTLGRGVLLAWVAGFLALAWAEQPSWVTWLPALGYGAAAALDAVDGAVARRTDRVTVLGTQLDMSFDAFGLLAASLVGIVAGQLPWWYLSVGMARYVFVAGIRLRERRGLPVYDLPPRASRRILAGLQMAFVAVALTPFVPPAIGVAGAGFFGGALLAGFTRDWLYVSGRLEPATPTGTEQPAD